MSTSADPLIDRFAAGPNVLAYAAEGLSPEQAQTGIGPGEWSISQLVAHLLDADLVLSERMKRVIAETDPVFHKFAVDAWIDRLDSRSMPMTEALELFAAHRRWMTRILRNCAESDFARTGQHSERGRQTLAEILAMLTNHVDHHLKFLYAKRANLGAAVPPRYTAQ